MIAAIRTEFIKLRTVRMHVVLMIVAVALPAVIVVLTAALQDTDDISASGLFDVTTGTATLTALMMAVLATSNTTGEFGFNTIRPTLAAIPSRWRVVITKAIVAMVTAAIVQLVVVVGVFTVARAIASGRDADVEVAEITARWAAVGGSIVFASVLSLIGVALGFLVRNTPATVAILVLWPLLLENLLAGLLAVAGVDDGLRWLPFQNGVGIAFADRGGTDWGRVASGSYFAAFALVLSVLASWTFHRRDA
jgi:ABC-2 type transport system permease protein